MEPEVDNQVRADCEAARKAPAGWLAPWPVDRLLVAILGAVVLAGGLWLFRSQERKVRLAEEEKLVAVATLEAQLVAQWRRERMADATLVRGTPYAARRAMDVLAQPGSATTEEMFTGWLERLLAGNPYRRARLLDAEGRQVLAYPADATPPLCESSRQAALHTVQSLATSVIDLHRDGDGEGEGAHFALAIPFVVRPEGGRDRAPAAGKAESVSDHVVAVLILDIRTEEGLFPLLRSWPTPSANAETLLVGRSEDAVLVLNPTRASAAGATLLQLPLTATRHPSVMAALGRQGIIEGLDDRGVDVLAAVAPVRDSSWSIVAKTDRAEVLAEWRRRAGLVLGLSFTGLACLGAVGVSLWQRDRAVRYRGLVSEVQASRAALLRAFEEQRQIEDRLREQAALLDATSDAVYVTDLEGTIRYWNRGAAGLYGWTAAEAAGRKAEEVLGCAPADLAPARALLTAKGEWSGELRTRNRAGTEIVVLGRWTLLHASEGRPRQVLAIATDLSEKKRLEAQFLRMQRLEGIGALASGIAHDLNNILTPILMTTPVLREPLSDADRGTLLDTIEACADRGAAIIRQVLTFARGTPGVRVPVPVRHLVRDLVRFMRETFPRDIECRMDLAKDLWLVLGDATQLHQALLNLCVNSRDAMPDGGRLTLEAANVTVDDAFAAMVPDARPGPCVRLAVTDTGVGIAPGQMHRIFEPFFTTKEPGKGTGLGLATVLGIVRGHGGFVRVDSRPRQGSTFEVFLPASPEAQPAAPAAAEPPPPGGQGELVLIVDDEAAIRQTLRRTLERHGYAVVEASQGAEALELFLAHRTEIRAVVTDLMMPVMNGPALIRELRNLDPGLPVLGMTGLPDRAGVRGFDELVVAALLTKPFASRDLLVGLRDALAAPGGTREASLGERTGVRQTGTA